MSDESLRTLERAARTDPVLGERLEVERARAGLFPGIAHLGQYRIVLADPPWAHENYGQAKHGAAKSNYPEVALADLCRMPVADLCHPAGALLFLWCTGPQAAQGAHVELARAWGFTLRARPFAWVKTTRSCGACEHAWDDHDAPVESGRYAAGGCEVSVVQDRIEALWPKATPRVELFARRRRPDWACWGGECPEPDLVFGDDIGPWWPVEKPEVAVAVPTADELSMFGAP